MTTVKHNEFVECLAEYPEFRFSSSFVENDNLLFLSEKINDIF